MPCPVKWSGLCRNRRGGGEGFREDLESAVTGMAQLGDGAQLQPPSGPGLREQLQTCFTLGRLRSRPSPETSGWGSMGTSALFTSQLAWVCWRCSDTPQPRQRRRQRCVFSGLRK